MVCGRGAMIMGPLIPLTVKHSQKMEHMDAVRFKSS